MQSKKKLAQEVNKRGSNQETQGLCVQVFCTASASVQDLVGLPAAPKGEEIPASPSGSCACLVGA